MLPLYGMKMPWYSACSVFLFLFRTNGKKGRLDENNFCQCYVFFSKVVLWKWYSGTAMFKVLSQQLRGTLRTAFWTIPYSWIICGHGSIRAKSFIKTLVNIMKKNWLKKIPGKRSVAQKPKRELRRTLHLNGPCFTYFIRFFFSQT